MTNSTLSYAIRMQSENCLGGELISDRAQKEVNKGNRKILIMNICFLKVIGYFPDFKQVLLYLFHPPIKRAKSTRLLHNVHLYY